MKTKTIFKTLAMAMMMPAMMLTTACSSDDDAVNNAINNNGKGYALPVTINVTRGGDDATRAEYNESTKQLEFSTGDQLFVQGTDNGAGTFAGTLTWQEGETFSGTIYTTNEYSGTADALLTSATSATATLLPSGYESIGYLTVSGDGYGATLATDAAKAFTTSKAAAVEQLSLEKASAYSDGFALAPQNAILNFTAVIGRWGYVSESYSVSLQAGETTISGSVAPVEGESSRALANFAIAVAGSATPSSLTLTVDGTSVSLGSHTLTAGKIYNQKCANINATSPMIGANEKWLVYGTGEPTGWRLSVTAGATVTLSNVNLSDASIVCKGNSTIILADGTTNSVTDAGHIGGPAIIYEGGAGTTLTIKGTGSLNVTGGYDNPAIGPMGLYESCGDITIANTVHLTATNGGGENVSKSITTNGGGTVTIGGKVYDGGADSPFEYPEPSTVTWDNTNVFIYDNRLVNIGNQGLNSGTYEGITVTYDGALCSSQFSFYDSDYGPVIDIYGNNGDSYTFTAPIGKKFTKIEINNNRTDEFTEHGDWTRESNNLVWEGTPSNAVTLGGSGTGETYCFVTSIVFTLQ